MNYSKFKKVTVATRLNPSTFNLLQQISKATKLQVATLIRTAITEYLKNMPENLPTELKIAIAHQLMKNNIETIKQLRWIYYAAQDAKLKLKYSEKHTDEKQNFPPHVRKTLRNLERNIINQQNQLDTWLKQHTPMLSNDADVQNVNTTTEET